MVLPFNTIEWKLHILVGLLSFFCLFPSQLFAFEYSTDTVIETDTIWTAIESPYILANGTRVKFQPGTTLTIEPGVVVKFDSGADLEVFGNLEVAGTEAQPVVFTSIKDDSVGGDTNHDGSASFPTRSDNWYFTIGDYRSSEGVHTEMSFVDIQYAGNGVLIENSSSNIHNVSIATSTNGMYFYLGEANLENFTVHNIYGWGVVFDTVSATVAGLHALNIKGDAVSFYWADGTLENIFLSDLRRGGIDVFNSTVSITELYVSNSPWSSSDIVDVYASEVDMQDTYISDVGTAAAIGAYNAQVTITDSLLQDGFGYGLRAYSWADGSSVTLDNVTITGFLDYGVSFNEVSVFIIDSYIIDNYIGIESYYGESEDVFTIENSFIAGNGLYGLVDYGSVHQIEAQGNWWGDASGPYHEVANLDGAGDHIEGDVDFSNWLTAPPGEVEEIDPLLLQYAPVLYMHPEEDYLPMNVEAFVEGSALWDQSGIDNQLRTEDALTLSEFETIINNEDTSNYYLSFSDPDNPKSLDLVAAKTKYDELVLSGGATTTVYVHKMEDAFTDNQGTQHEFIVLQYWYFYAMNNWKEQGGRNNHEGDWESIFIFLDKDTKEPMYVAYSTHLNDGDPSLLQFQYDSVRRAWNSPEIVFDNEQVISFVSLGSHANYSNNGIDGEHAVDITTSDFTSNYGQYLGVGNFNTDILSGKIWFESYAGKWGADGVFPGTDGPQGPLYIDLTGQVRFEEPIEWAGLDKVTNLVVSSPASTFSFASSTVGMWFSNALEVGTELSVSIHDEFINFGTNVGDINLLPKFWDFGTSLVNGTFDVSVSLTYTQEQLAQWGVDEEFMQVYFYNEVENLWEPVQSRLDAVSGKIQFDTDHFSRYAVGSPVLTSLDERIVVKSHFGAYDQTTNTREVVVSLHNTGTTTLAGTVRVVVYGLSEEGIKLLDASGVTASGSYYVDLPVASLESKEKLVLPPLLVKLPTEIKASQKQSEKKQKENTRVKQFEYEVGVYSYL